MKIPPPGNYMAKLSGRMVVYEAQTGSLNVAIPCVIDEGEHAGFTTKATVCIVNKDGAIMQAGYDNLKTIFGIDGTDPFVLMDKDYADVRFALNDCKHEEYEGKTQFKPGWVNPIGGGMKIPEAADRKSVLAKYGSKFRALAAAPAAPSKSATSAPSKPASPKAPELPAAAPSNQEEAWAEFCKANAGKTQDEMAKLWFDALEKEFPGRDQGSLTPLEWGKFKASIDYVPM